MSFMLRNFSGRAFDDGDDDKVSPAEQRQNETRLKIEAAATLAAAEKAWSEAKKCNAVPKPNEQSEQSLATSNNDVNVGVHSNSKVDKNDST